MVFSFAGEFASRLSLLRSCLPAALFAVAASGPAHAQEDKQEADALSVRGVSGEILDTAVEHCRRGERAQAMSMFQAIRDQLDPPPAIRRAMEDLEATGCAAQEIAKGGVFRLQAGGGWDSNVSQGISARSLVLGSGDATLELELDSSYRPRASWFSQASFDYTLALPDAGWFLQAGVGTRKNASVSTFDLTTLSASGAREFKLGRHSLRAQAELGEIWLGGQHYQRTQGGTLQWLAPGTDGAWLTSLSATRVRYLTQDTQDAMQYEAGLLREQRLSAATTVYGGFALQRDNASSTRPGGDRSGYQVQAGALLLAAGWRFKPQLSYTRFDSKDAFAPGLLDMRRRNRLTQVVLQAERPLSPQTSLVLEWRQRSARDTIVLYSYNARAITATLAHRF